MAQWPRQTGIGPAQTGRGPRPSLNLVLRPRRSHRIPAAIARWGHSELSTALPTLSGVGLVVLFFLDVRYLVRNRAPYRWLAALVFIDVLAAIGIVLSVTDHSVAWMVLTLPAAILQIPGGLLEHALPAEIRFLNRYEELQRIWNASLGDTGRDPRLDRLMRELASCTSSNSREIFEILMESYSERIAGESADAPIVRDRESRLAALVTGLRRRWRQTEDAHGDQPRSAR